MATLEDISDYGPMFDSYLAAYNRKQEILASPINELDRDGAGRDMLKGQITINAVYDYDKIVNGYKAYTDEEVASLDATMAENLPDLLDFFNNKASDYPVVVFPDKGQQIKPFGSEAVIVAVWPDLT